MIFKIPAISQNVNAEIHQKTEQENSKHTYNGMLFGFFQIWISLFEKASGNFKINICHSLTYFYTLP